MSPANPLLPAPIRPLGAHGLLVPAFVALWVVGVLLDCLPTVDERIALAGVCHRGPVGAARGADGRGRVVHRRHP